MDQTGTPAARYGRVAMAFHWIIAILIALNFAAAWVAEDQPQAVRAQIMDNHMAFGVTILVLSVLRIVWRLSHRPPPLAETLRAWEAAIGKVVHSLFYVLMIAIPLAGWAMVSSGSGRPVSIFGWFAVPSLPVSREKAVTETFNEVHETLATVLLLLMALHIAAALKHHFFDRDSTLVRMVPFLRRIAPR